MAKKECVSKTYTTGKGEVVGFVNLFEPSVKFNENGVYQCGILVPKKEGEALAKIIEDIADEQYKSYRMNNKRVEITNCIPYIKTEKDEKGRIKSETPDPEGRYIIKAKAGAYIKDGKIGFKPIVIDAKKNKVLAANIAAGSVVRLGVVLEGYSSPLGTGVSIKLKTAQIIDLVEYGGVDVDSFGFEDEDGFEASEEQMTAATTTEGTNEEEQPDF